MIDEKELIKQLQQCINTSDNSNFTNGLLSAVDIVNQQPKIGEWILCSKRLPEEPEEIPTEDEPIEEMMLNGKFQECIVIIWGVDEAITLYYIGNNEWYDGISGETYYKVIAWQPMPKIL